MLKNLMKHQSDLMINEDNVHPVYFGGIARQLISPKSSNEKVPPPLMSAIILAALNNTKYPDSLLATVIRRVKQIVMKTKIIILNLTTQEQVS